MLPGNLENNVVPLQYKESPVSVNLYIGNPV